VVWDERGEPSLHSLRLRGIDQFQYIKIQLKTIEYEALGNNYRVYGVYSPEPRAEVYCVRLNFNISKLVLFFISR